MVYPDPITWVPHLRGATLSSSLHVPSSPIKPLTVGGRFIVQRNWPKDVLTRARRVAALSICILVAGLLPGPAVPARSAAPIPIPPLARIEHGAYQARDAATGEELWQVHWSAEKSGAETSPIVHFHERGSGHPDQYVPSVWTVDMQIALWDADAHLSSIREAWDDSGHPLELEHRAFDYTKGKGVIRTTELRTGATRTKTVPLTIHSIPPELLAAALRLLPEQPDGHMAFDLTTREGYVIGMEAWIVGREQVTVPAGGFECYKLELDPTGVAGVLAKVFRLPKLYMWHTVTAPHIWVKYQGLEAGPGSRLIIRELVTFRSE